MDLPDSLHRALQRLDGALDALDAAADRRAATDAPRADAEAELSALQDDRSRLALELDAALARARALDSAADDVSGRLERIGAVVRGILAELGAGEAAPPRPAPASRPA